MAIKKLQNNFTTPEQSRRLLVLGVPKDSADCYYETFDSHDQNDFRLQVRQNPKELSNSLFNDYHRLIPCWSVGRLMEIYLTCVLEYHPYDDFYTETPSLHLMAFDKDRLIEEVIEIMSDDKMDFSKLED